MLESEARTVSVRPAVVGKGSKGTVSLFPLRFVMVILFWFQDRGKGVDRKLTYRVMIWEDNGIFSQQLIIF